MTGPAAPLAAEHRCPNCTAPAPRRFCAECGQRQDRRLASVRRMAMEAIHDQFSLGTELPRTLGALLTRPGLLTNDYLAGRVARYVAPFRLYLVSSLVFFVLLSWTAPMEDGVQVDRRAAAPADPAAEGPRTSPPGGDVGPVRISLDSENEIRFDLDLDTIAPGPLTPAKRWIQRRVQHVNEMEGGEFRRRFVDGLQANVPNAVFLLLPIYALLLKVVYVRDERLYAEHFIFALHVHAFAFVVFTLRLFLPGFADLLIFLVWLPVYLFVAMRRVYGQGRWTTALKYAFLFVAYNVALGLLLGATALVTALTV